MTCLAQRPEMAPLEHDMVFYSLTLPWIRLNYCALGRALIGSSGRAMHFLGHALRLLRRGRSLTADEMPIKATLFPSPAHYCASPRDLIDRQNTKHAEASYSLSKFI